jgi:hypothetical protein
MCGGVPELRGVGVQVVEHILLVLRLQFEPVPSRTCIHSLRFVPIENDNLAKIIPSKLPFNELNYCDKKERDMCLLPLVHPDVVLVGEGRLLVERQQLPEFKVVNGV